MRKSLPRRYPGREEPLILLPTLEECAHFSATLQQDKLYLLYTLTGAREDGCVSLKEEIYIPRPEKILELLHYGLIERFVAALEKQPTTLARLGDKNPMEALETILKLKQENGLPAFHLMEDFFTLFPHYHPDRQPTLAGYAVSQEEGLFSRALSRRYSHSSVHSSESLSRTRSITSDDASIHRQDSTQTDDPPPTTPPATTLEATARPSLARLGRRLSEFFSREA